jgi:hypothetical protein
MSLSIFGHANRKLFNIFSLVNTILWIPFFEVGRQSQYTIDTALVFEKLDAFVQSYVAPMFGFDGWQLCGPFRMIPFNATCGK